MNLRNIHFHKGAEHKGGELTTYAGKGYGSGYFYNCEFSQAKFAPLDYSIRQPEHGDLQPDDTIEVHYVHTSAKVEAGPTLGACLSEAIKNPQFRVKPQVYVFVNDERAVDFMYLTALAAVNGFHQTVNIPTDTDIPIK